MKNVVVAHGTDNPERIESSSPGLNRLFVPAVQPWVNPSNSQSSTLKGLRPSWASSIPGYTYDCNPTKFWPRSVMPQSLSAIYIHLVFSTKNRRPLLRDEVKREALHAY